MKSLLSLLAIFFAFNCFGAEVRAVLEPKEQTLITSEVNSTVKKINRKMGEAFKEGDELVLLDDVVFLANLMKANAQVTKAQTDFESAQKLYADKVISHSDFRQTEAALAVTKADLALAQKAYDACFIRAPYSGEVIDVFVKEHERVQPGQNIISLLDDSVLVARVLVPEIYQSKLKVGDVVQVLIRETNVQEKATIVRIGAVIDPVSSLLKVEAEIDNANGSLKAGMEGMLVLTNTDMKRP